MMVDSITRLEDFCRQHTIACERNVPLAGHSTFRIGGPARLYLRPGSEEQIALVYAQAQRLSVPMLVFGKGSNILFPDEGVDYAVLQIGPAYAGMRLVDEVTIDCDAGAALSQLCIFACEHGLRGLEFAYGIPGSVGGAIYMNAGAYGGEMKDVLIRTRHVLPEGTTGSLEGTDLALSYRHSAYTGGNRIITGGLFRLEPDEPSAIRSRMDEYMQRRRDKQPLDYPSAGSTFKRPEGNYASALIDRCGLKGRRVGGAMVSEKHAGFIVNAGGATAKDVRELMAVVRQEVFEQTGYRLESEVQIVE